MQVRIFDKSIADAKARGKSPKWNQEIAEEWAWTVTDIRSTTKWPLLLIEHLTRCCL